ncbi:MAG TPA: hypothetical protein VHJ76_08590 [Actinomycetota bacterium]|nr:hypothetical protein [Actinomycetota bacterium]
MVDLHRFVAYSVPAGFALLALGALFTFLRNREPGGWYWNLLGAVQVILGAQVIVGAILFAMGGRPQSNGPNWLHYVYGGLFPIGLLYVAHRYARKHPGVEVVIFGVACLVAFGLTFRALQTGLGTD